MAKYKGTLTASVEVSFEIEADTEEAAKEAARVIYFDASTFSDADIEDTNSEVRSIDVFERE